MTRALSVAFLLAALPVTQGAIVFTEIGLRGQVILLGDATIPIDFNGDGETELQVVFSGPGSDATVITTNSTRMAAIPATPPDLGSTAFNYLAGESVGSILPFGSLEYFAGRGNLRSCRNIGCLGLFAGGIHFLGVEFVNEGSTHYGYVEIDIPFDAGVAAGQVLAYAYETRPDTPIIAGNVPEPASLLLLSLGGLMAASRRTRNP